MSATPKTVNGIERRSFMKSAAMSAFACTTAGTQLVLSAKAWAQTYPARPVHWIVPFTPGGVTDIVARLLGEWLAERLGQPFVIENRPGAGGNIGTAVVVRAPADGYTLLLVGPFNAINASLYQNLNFNFIDDIAPVARLIGVPLVMVANPSVPAATVPEFIAYAKANPGKVNMASSGIGGLPHVAGELFKIMAGTWLTCLIAALGRP